MRFVFPVALAATVLAASACDSATEPARPANVVANADIEQNVVVGAPVPLAPSVRVTTSSGKPVRNVEVTFAIAQGGGTLAYTAARTDATGAASAGGWVAGPHAGDQEVVATIAELPAARVTFRARAAADVPRRLSLVTQPPAQILDGAPVSPRPALQLRDQYGNNAPAPGILVTASVAGGTASLANATVATDAQGIATFADLVINAQPGTYTLQFTAASLPDATASTIITILADAAACAAPALDLTLGQFQRYALADGTAPTCIRFDAGTNAGQQYLLLFENMPPHGGFETGVFPGPVADTSFALTLRMRPHSVVTPMQPTLRSITAAAPRPAPHSWDFGDGPIFEHEPVMPAGGVPEPQLLRAGHMMDLHSAAAAPQVGDTIVVRMEGIPRLNITSGNQRAVIRHISDELIIAEDVRLGTTLVRQSGNVNTPLSAARLDSIAREYAAIARVQGDLLFEGRFNSSIESNTPQRVIAVHSLMFADNIWGYTYTTGDYFVWDYWVGTDGVVAGNSQNAQRVADNLIMHEIAHMRHWGLLQRNGSPPRGNRWLVEGFARHTERLAIANRLLGVVTPSRTANVVLPRNPVFGNTYFRDDVPTFLNGGTSMHGGYQHASFVFDYFMDQVAVAGGDPMNAVRDLVINAGNRTTADGAVSRWLPGMSFGELFTRARIALYLDDIGTAGLPPWTQYHQYQLRTSRPAGSAAASDPRNAWPKLAPGTLADMAIVVPNGAAFGLVLDGTQAAAATGTVTFDAPMVTGNAFLSITRIR